jgi:hypothetical protein
MSSTLTQDTGLPMAGRNPETAPPQPSNINQPETSLVRRLLQQPLVGFAPWILLSLVEGPNRLVLAAALAGALAVVTTIVGLTLSVRPKLLDITATVFFGALAAWAALANPGTARWLELWAGDLSCAAIAAIAGLSLLLRRPFTLQYARESVDPAFWTSSLFIRINYVITSVWVSVFGLIAAVGFIGDGPLHQPDNIWTNWVIQIALVILAIKFTNWYPTYATADFEGSGRSRSERHADLLRRFARLLAPLGILIMVVAGPAWWVGAAILVAGIIVSAKLRRVAS